VIVGLGTLVLFQALMNPTRLMLGVAAALTFGGILTDTATSDAKDRVASKNTQNLLLDIRTYDCGRMLITLSSVGDRTIPSFFLSDMFE
jgi:hypothetical protein